jgi:1-phosphatidylinositol phosphodiesterase
MKRLSIFAITALALVSRLSFAAQTVYSHDSTAQVYFPNWMGALPGSTYISQMTLPGTHETLATVGGDIVQCQSMGLLDQLNSGIRVIDVRLGPAGYGTTLSVYHGSIFQNLTFDEVMVDLNFFLTLTAPTDTVFMRVSNEQPDQISSGQNTYDNGLSPMTAAQFTTAFKAYWKQYQGLFYDPNASGNQGYGKNPQLSVLRGKLVVLDDFSSNRVIDITTYGINYSNLTAQDNYTVSDNWDLYTKWTEVKTALQAAHSAQLGSMPANANVYINYLSASGGSFPYFIASGKSSNGTNAPQLMTGEISPFYDTYPDFPLTSCWAGMCSVEFMGTNGLTSTNLAAQYAPLGAGRQPSAATGTTHIENYGIIMADFPGGQLISQLIDLNFVSN